MIKKIIILMLLSAFAYAEAPQDLIKLKGKWSIITVGGGNIKTTDFFHAFDFQFNKYTRYDKFDTIVGDFIAYTGSKHIDIMCVDDYDDIYIRSQYICFNRDRKSKIIMFFINNVIDFDHHFSGEFATGDNLDEINEKYDNQTTSFFIGVKKKNPVVISVF